MPVVFPSKTPDNIWTVSSSLRAVVTAEVPGFLRSRKGWMSSSDKGSPAGQPSMTAPSAGPWDSPQVVTVKCLPNVEPAMLFIISFL